MSQWAYKTTVRSEEMLLEAAEVVMDLCRCSEREAIDRINSGFAPDIDIDGVLDADGPDGLARELCYGDWWWLSKPPLVVKPYPEASPFAADVDWAFQTDADSDAFLKGVVVEMARRFQISASECIRRVNAHWSHLERIDSTDIIFHELPDYWACDIYFGHDSEWWLTTPSSPSKPMPEGQKEE